MAFIAGALVHGVGDGGKPCSDRSDKQAQVAIGMLPRADRALDEFRMAVNADAMEAERAHEGLLKLYLAKCASSADRSSLACANCA
jgi:hypothetical protein